MAVNALAGLARDAAASPFMRGLTALPYRLAGAPVDLADMVVRPIANAAGIPIAEPQNMYGTSDWMMKQAMDAGLLMPRTDTGAEMAGDFLGQLAAPGVGPAEAGTAKAIFAGPLALTADHDALARATARLDAGDDPAKVWAEDGWFRGPDGKMRFEIDDSQAAISDDFAGNASGRVRNVLSHDSLYAAYPQIHDFTGYSPTAPRGLSGSYEPSGEYVTLNPSLTQDKARSTILHELQHNVQDLEGFGKGGDIGRAREVISDASQAARYNRARIQSLIAQGHTPETSLELVQLMAQTAEQSRIANFTPELGYRYLPGEAESRAVERRRDMTPEQRRAMYPLSSYDVRPEDLISPR